MLASYHWPWVTVSILSAMISRLCRLYRIPVVPIEIPSLEPVYWRTITLYLTPIVLNWNPTSPAFWTPSLTNFPSFKRCMLQGLPSYQLHVRIICYATCTLTLATCTGCITLKSRLGPSTCLLPSSLLHRLSYRLIHGCSGRSTHRLRCPLRLWPSYFRTVLVDPWIRRRHSATHSEHVNSSHKSEYILCKAFLERNTFALCLCSDIILQPWTQDRAPFLKKG